MNAETRAKEIEEAFLKGSARGESIAGFIDGLEEGIGKAIHEAVNIALQAAADAAESVSTFEWRGGEEWAAGYVDGKNAAAKAIRELIEKD